MSKLLFSLLLIGAIIQSSLVRADLTTLGPSTHLNIDASATGLLGLSMSEIITQSGASSYVPMAGKLKARVEYYSGLLGIGGEFYTDRVSNDQTKNPGRLDIDVDLAFALVNDDGKVIALAGTFGFRNQSQQEHFGSAFTDGYGTTTNDLLSFKAGGKINVLLPIINGQIKVMFLPILNRWELESEIKVKLKKILTKFNVDLGFVDNVVIDFYNGAPMGNSTPTNAIVGRVYLLLEKAIISLDNEPGGGGVYLLYGAGVEWDSRRNTPNVVITIGVKIKI